MIAHELRPDTGCLLLNCRYQYSDSVKEIQLMHSVTVYLSVFVF
jgi:hypothetical protein